MEQIQIKAPAKINLSLDIVGVRPDGYHLMQMVMQTVSLFDDIKLRKNDSKEIILSCDKTHIPLGQTNIAHKVATAFFEYAKLNEGVCIDMKKNIPTGAGMGGGSADGAGVLLGLNHLFQTNLRMEELIAIGQKVGADIPFCLIGGTALVEGIGEIITPLKPIPNCDIVIAKPRTSINTKRAFVAYDNQTSITHPNTAMLLESINRQDLSGITNQFCNVFEQTVPLKELSILKETILSHGALGAMMTGSGSAVFGVFTDYSKAQNCITRLRQERLYAFLCEPYFGGPCIF